MENVSSTDANSAMRRKLDELQPDIVFAGAIAFPSGAAAVRWAFENNKKCIVFDNARLQDVPRRWFVNFIKKKVYSAVDAILCPAPAWNDTFRYFGFTDGQIFYGLNVVDNSSWFAGELDSETGLPERYFLAVGRQVSKKNFLLLLHSFHQYSNNAANPYHLVLIGDGTEHDQLVSYAQENKLEKLVHFYPFMSQVLLKSFYRNARWLVLPSRYGETWGLVVNEAMASGLPVLVSNQAGCASTLVKEEVNGFTFSPDNMVELTRLLLKAASLEEDQRKAMGRISEEIISEWGLERFCSSVYDAIKYASVTNKRMPDMLGRLIIKLWKGRYRPV